MTLTEQLFATNVSLWISFAALMVMVYCLWLVVTLKSTIPGGIIGKQWNTLLLLVGLFSVGYLATPFFGAIPSEYLHLIISAIFFFGALYVLLTIRLIYQVIREVNE